MPLDKAPMDPNVGQGQSPSDFDWKAQKRATPLAGSGEGRYWKEPSDMTAGGWSKFSEKRNYDDMDQTPGYVPTYWEDPQNLAYHWGQIASGQVTPEELAAMGLDPAAMYQAAELYSQYSGSTDPNMWIKPASDELAFRHFLQTMKAPGDEYKYNPAAGMVIAADKLDQEQIPINLNQWNMTDEQYAKLPFWQKGALTIFGGGYGGAATGLFAGGTETFLENLSEGPKKAIASGIFGGIFASGIGHALVKKLVDEETGEMKYPQLNGVFNALDFLSRTTERVAGTATLLGYGALGSAEHYIQKAIADYWGAETEGVEFSSLPRFTEMITDLDDLTAMWRAGGLSYEAGLKLPGADDQFMLKELYDPEMTELDTWGMEAFMEIYDDFRNMSTTDTIDDIHNKWVDHFGFEGEMRDLVGSIIADPLNFTPLLLVRGIPKAAKFASKMSKLLGFVEVAGEGISDAMSRAVKNSRGPIDLAVNYRKELQMLPQEQKSALSSFKMKYASLAVHPDTGKVELKSYIKGKALDSKLTIGKRVAGGLAITALGAGVGTGFGPWGIAIGALGGFTMGFRKGWDYLTNLTPTAAAAEFTNGMARNVVAVLDNAKGAKETTDAVRAFIQTPYEWSVKAGMLAVDNAYTGPGALAGRGMLTWLDDTFNLYEANQATILPILDDIARSTGKTLPEVIGELTAEKTVKADILYNKWVSSLGEATDMDDAARASLKNIQDKIASGEINKKWIKEAAANLKKTGTAFDEGTYKVAVLQKYVDTVQQYNIDYFGVKPEAVEIRLSQTLKAAQSVLLLGLNPTYLFNNILNNWLTMAAEGVFKGGTLDSNLKYWSELGISSQRLQEGYGIAGEFITGLESQLAKATKADDAIQKTGDAMRKVTDKIGWFQKWSGNIEKLSSVQSMTKAMKNFLSRNWRRGRDIPVMSMPARLAVNALDGSGDLEKAIYYAIESGMNPKQIEERVFSKTSYRLVNDIVDEIASKHNMPAADIMEQLDELGIPKVLNDELANAKDARDIYRVYYNLEKNVQDFLDSKWGDTIAEFAERVKQQVADGAAGPWAVIDLIDRSTQHLYDAFDLHWHTMDDAYSLQQAGRPGAVKAALMKTRRNWNRAWKIQNTLQTTIFEAFGGRGADLRSVSRSIDDISEGWQSFYKRADKLWADLIDKKSVYTADQIKAMLKDEAKALYKFENLKMAEIDEAYIRLFKGQYGEVADQPARNWLEGRMKIKRKIQKANLDFREIVENMHPSERKGAWSRHKTETLNPLLGEMNQATLEGAAEFLRQVTGRTNVDPTDMGRADRVTAIREVLNAYGMPTQGVNWKRIDGVAVPVLGGELDNNYVMRELAKYGEIPDGVQYLHEMDPEDVLDIVRERARQKYGEDWTPDYPTPFDEDIKNVEANIQVLEETDIIDWDSTDWSWQGQRKDMPAEISQDFHDMAAALLNELDSGEFEGHVPGMGQGSGYQSSNVAWYSDMYKSGEYKDKKTLRNGFLRIIANEGRDKPNFKNLRIAKQMVGDALVEGGPSGTPPLPKYQLFAEVDPWYIRENWIMHREAFPDQPDDFFLNYAGSQKNIEILDALAADPNFRWTRQDLEFKTETNRLKSARLDLERLKARRAAHPPDTAYYDTLAADAPKPITGPINFVENFVSHPPVILAQNQGWMKLAPILEDLKQIHLGRTGTNASQLADFADATPDQIKAIKKWLDEDVYPAYADTKARGVVYAEGRRDMALLNYGHTYGFDSFTSMVMPYQFWYGRSMVNWIKRSVDRPGWLMHWARIRQMQSEQETLPGFPRRLEGKMHFNIPWMPESMKGLNEVWFDPLRNLFPAEFVGNSFLSMADDRSEIERRAYYILNDRLEADKITEEQFEEALATQSGDLYEEVWAQAAEELDLGISNAYDLITTLSGPLLPIAWAHDWIRGKPEKIGLLPATKTIKGITSITNIGQATGSPGGWNAEKGIRTFLNMPTEDEFQPYRVDRELSNMVHEGYELNGKKITYHDAWRAMVERKGDLFDAAVERVGDVGFVKTFTGSLGVDLFPEGEEKSRLLQREFYAAMDAGKADVFFDDHPEYKARMEAMRGWDEPEVRQFNITKALLWEVYHEMKETNYTKLNQLTKRDRAFREDFLGGKESGYANVTTEQMATWLDFLGGEVYEGIPIGEMDLSAPMPSDLEMDQITWFYDTREAEFGANIGMVNNLYWALNDIDKARARQYKDEHPELEPYWDFNRAFKTANPNLKEAMEYNEQEQMSEALGIERYTPEVQLALSNYVYARQPLDGAARDWLYAEWISLGGKSKDFDGYLRLIELTLKYPFKQH